MTNRIDEFIFGSGELYLVAATDGEIPEDATIEVEANNVGHCSGGATLEYKPEAYDVKNQYNKVVKRFIKGEEVSFKTGILTWNLDMLSKLSNARVETVTKNSKQSKKLVFGAGGSLASNIVRFVHTKDNGKKVRITLIGQAGNGFALEFSGEKETTIDAEFMAVEKKKGFLCEVREEQ
ncbi:MULTISPECIES: hypothetical protein [unclassified Gemella]|uniref:hypothetical protein n=1 Tax=unclassified Gemella TaxID=2624949 RepID=UPI001C0520F4|nr:MULTISPECIES: hypothetical protein [unclassified Gemella]MBU0279211.1 hypothetical protein [Gemella sp. zg-1178]QWQ39316.1 hypothetical protein KMP11_03035 [Gemella sp. zg-570]